MDTSLYISAGALQTFQKKVDNISNNVANVNTNGFKRKETSFSEALATQMMNQNMTDQEIGRLTPQGIRVGYGSKLGLTQLEMDQGQPISTGNPFDLMIKGKGFFQIGYNDGTIRYTRDGAFHISPDPNQPGNYHLVNQNGGYLLDENSQPIVLNDQDQVKISDTGEISLQNKAGNGSAVQSNQRVGIVDIQNPHVLRNMGDNQYEIARDVLTPGTNAANYVRFMQPAETEVLSGYLEGSNVDLTKEMADLMVSQRGFQLNSRAVAYADQMMGIANSILK